MVYVLINAHQREGQTRNKNTEYYHNGEHDPLDKRPEIPNSEELAGHHNSDAKAVPPPIPKSS